MLYLLEIGVSIKVLGYFVVEHNLDRKEISWYNTLSVDWIMNFLITIDLLLDIVFSKNHRLVTKITFDLIILYFACLESN